MGKVKKGATWIFIIIPWYLAFGLVSLVLYGAFKALEVSALTPVYDGGAKTEAILLYIGPPMVLAGVIVLMWIIGWLTTSR